MSAGPGLYKQWRWSVELSSVKPGFSMPSDIISISDISGTRRATSRNLVSLVSTSPPKSLLSQASLQQFSADDPSSSRRFKHRVSSATQSFMMGATFSYIRSKLLLFIGDTLLVDELLATDSTTTEILNFMKADGPRKLTFFFQVHVKCTVSAFRSHYFAFWNLAPNSSDDE